MTRPDHLDANVAWGIGSHVIGVVVVFATTPYVARGLGVSDYGLLNVCLAVGLWIGFAYLMFSKTTIRFVGDAIGRGNVEEAAQIAGALRRASAIAGVVAGAVLAIAAPWIVDKAFKIGPLQRDIALQGMYAECAYVLFQIMASVESGVVAANQRFDVFQGIRLGGVLVQGVGWVACVLNGRGVSSVLWWMTWTQVMEWSVYAYWSRRLLPPMPGWAPSLSSFGVRFGEFGGLLLAGFAVAQMFTPASRLLTGALSSMEQVGYLSIVITLAGNLRLLCVHIDNALLPVVSERNGAGDMEGVRAAYFRALRWAWVSLIPLAGLIGFMGDEFIRYWINAEFAVGVHSFIWPLVIGLLALYVSGIPAGVLQGLGRPRPWVAAIALTAALNFVLDVTWIPGHGATGAAYAIAASGASLAVGLFVAAGVASGSDWRSHFKAMDARVVVATIVIGGIVDRLAERVHSLFAVCALAALACAALAAVSPWWLTKDELDAVRRKIGAL